MARPTWDEYFLQIAEVVSTRSTCQRSQCGAIIVKDNKIMSTGYNGSPKYQRNCEELGTCFRNNHNIRSGTELEKCRAVGCHAETNSIALAARQGGTTDQATIFVFGNTHICDQCRGMIANAGIIRVIHKTKEGKIYEFHPEKDWRIHTLDLIEPIDLEIFRVKPLMKFEDFGIKMEKEKL